MFDPESNQCLSSFARVRLEAASHEVRIEDPATIAEALDEPETVAFGPDECGHLPLIASSAFSLLLQQTLPHGLIVLGFELRFKNR